MDSDDFGIVHKVYAQNLGAVQTKHIFVFSHFFPLRCFYIVFERKNGCCLLILSLF